jgi:hypothetical protein
MVIKLVAVGSCVILLCLVLHQPILIKRRLEGIVYDWSSNIMNEYASFAKESIYVQDDGTLYVTQTEESQACSFFTDLPGLPKRIEGKPSRLHFHLDDCSDDHLGMKLSEYLGHYLLANAAQIPYTMTCGNGSDEDKGSVIGFLQVNNSIAGPPPTDMSGHVYSMYDVCFNCYGLNWWCDRGLELTYDIFKENMWRLATTKVGEEVESEDAVIHLRLGDALTGGVDEGTGLLPFMFYSRLLKLAESQSGPLQTISVVTQVFDEESARPEDIESIKGTELIAHDFVAYLREFFPDSIVKLHNSISDTPFVAYVRLTKANKVAICGSSTFCTYPVLANPNLKFLYESRKLNPWVNRIGYLENVRTFEAPLLTNNYIGSLTDEQVLMWLRNQNPNSNEIIFSPPLIRTPKTKFFA